MDSVELYDLNARYYNPKTARFLSEDPYFNLGNRVIGLYEINVPNVLSVMQANALYVYCGENPVKFTDPYGKGFGMIVLLSMILLPIGYGLLAHDAAMPSHNYDQNAQMDEAVNRYHLSKEGRRLLHDEIKWSKLFISRGYGRSGRNCSTRREICEMSKPSSECLNLLTNKRLSKLGHAANMLWISFGQDIMVTDYRGKQKCVGEYALHIQCPWRITRKQDVLLSSRDMISLRENDSANSFESKCAYLCSYLKENTELVESVHMNCFGDITIQCTNIQIDSFVCTSGVCESWRLIDSTSGTHYVMEEED